MTVISLYCFSHLYNLTYTYSANEDGEAVQDSNRLY